jgi:hypothetical protein
MINKTFAGLMMALLPALIPAAACAGVLEGSRPLLCAVMHGTQCEAETQTCRSGAPWNLDLPVFIDIDFKKMTASTTRSDADVRQSKIEHMKELPGNMLSLQAAEGEYSWSAVISDYGSLTLVIAGQDIAFTVFGACTPR